MSDGTGASQDPLHLALKEQIHQYYDVGRKMAESQQLQHRRTSLPAASMPMTATDMNNYSNINSSSNSNSMQALNSIAAAADLSSNIMHAGHVRRDSGGGVLRQGGGGSFDLQGGGQRGSAHAPSTPQFSPPGSYTINTALDVFNGMISPQLPLQQTTLSTTAGMGMDLLALPQLPPSAAPISEATSLHVLSEHQRIHLQQQQQQQQQQRDFAALVNAAAAANQQRTLSSPLQIINSAASVSFEQLASTSSSSSRSASNNSNNSSPLLNGMNLVGTPSSSTPISGSTSAAAIAMANARRLSSNNASNPNSSSSTLNSFSTVPPTGPSIFNTGASSVSPSMAPSGFNLINMQKSPLFSTSTPPSLLNTNVANMIAMQQQQQQQSQSFGGLNDPSLAFDVVSAAHNDLLGSFSTNNESFQALLQGRSGGIPASSYSSSSSSTSGAPVVRSHAIGSLANLGVSTLYSEPVDLEQGDSFIPNTPVTAVGSNMGSYHIGSNHQSFVGGGRDSINGSLQSTNGINLGNVNLNIPSSASSAMPSSFDLSFTHTLRSNILHPETTSNLQAYHCPFQDCSKVFHCPQTLGDHIRRIHASSSMNQCPFCPRCFLHHTRLETHVAEDHAPLLAKMALASLPKNIIPMVDELPHYISTVNPATAASAASYAMDWILTSQELGLLDVQRGKSEDTSSTSDTSVPSISISSNTNTPPTSNDSLHDLLIAPLNNPSIHSTNFDQPPQPPQPPQRVSSSQFLDTPHPNDPRSYHFAMPHLWRLTPSASTPENAPMKPMTSPLPPPSVPNLLFDDSTAARYQQHYHPEAFLPFMQTSTFEEQGGGAPRSEVVEGSSMRKAKVEPETSFTCTVDDCGKTFPTQAQLSAHRKTHGKPHEKFRCEYPECGKVFPQVKSLLVHSRIHTGDRPYVCPYPDCGRAFVQASGLRSHNYTHTGERPYKCSVCPKSYTTSSRLKIHFRDHTDELPYVCGFEGCNKQFKQSSNLRQHEITHIPRSDRIPVIRGLACGFCGQAYKTDDSLDQHIRKAHPGRTLSESNDMASRMGLPGTFKRKDEEDEEEGEGVTGKRVKVEECETPPLSVSPPARVGGGTQSAGGQTVTAPQTPVEKEGFDMGNL